MPSGPSWRFYLLEGAKTMGNHVKHSPDARASALAESRRRALELAVERHGKARVLKVTGISEPTFWRAVAGGPLYRGTCVIIDQALAELESAAT